MKVVTAVAPEPVVVHELAATSTKLVVSSVDTILILLMVADTALEAVI